MILKIDRIDKNKSVYTCDYCNKTMSIEERKGIYVTNNVGQPRKRWDLCNTCFKMLERGIEKGK